MANKTKKKVAAPQVEAPTVENNNNKDAIQVLDLTKVQKDFAGTSKSGLDPNHQVDLLTGLKGMFHDDPNAAERYGVSQESVDGVNRITAIGFVTVLANEVTYAKNPFAMKMNQAVLEGVKKVCEDPSIGISIDTKLLPAPDAEGNVQVPSQAVKVSAETQKKVKAEHEAAVKAENKVADPTKVKDDEGLKEGLLIMLASRANTHVYGRIKDAIAFYKSVKQIQAKESGDEAAVEAVNNLDDADILKEIVNVVGPNDCPFESLNIGSYMRSTLLEDQSAVRAFCTLYGASKSAAAPNGETDDNLLAQMVKMLVVWANNTYIAKEEAKIAKLEAANEKMSKDKSKIGEINANKDKIETGKKNIAYYEESVKVITDPSFDVADDFIESYSEKTDKSHKIAVNIFNAIMLMTIRNKFTAAKMKIDKLPYEKNEILKYAKNYAGYITNLFVDPLSRNISYQVAPELPTPTVEEAEDELAKKQNNEVLDKANAKKEEDSKN